MHPETTLQDVARAASDAHQEIRDVRAIPYEMDNLGQQVDMLNAHLAQLEDRLGPVRAPFDTARLDSGGAPKVPVAPLAETLRGISVGLSRAIERVDQMLADIEL